MKTRVELDETTKRCYYVRVSVMDAGIIKIFLRKTARSHVWNDVYPL